MKADTMILDEGSGALEEVLTDVTVVHFARNKGWNSSVTAAIEELHLTVASAVGKPVYVASSMGGFTGLGYANRYPGSLAALILLDPSHPDQGQSAISILEDFSTPKTPAYADLWSFFRRSNEASETGSAEVSQITTLGALPLLVLAMSRAPDLFSTLPEHVQNRLIDDRRQLLREYARLSSKGTFQIVDSVGHGMVQEAPERIATIIRTFLSRTTLQSDVREP